jgi:hypothetical protein
MGMNNEFNYRWEGAIQIRTCPYQNNIVEQDHRRVKSRVGPMLGFKRFFNARRVLAGVELVHKIIKGQFGLPESFGTVESKDGRTKHAALASSETFRPYRRYRLPYANETQKGGKKYGAS